MTIREELYQLVWAEPMIRAAARFEVSGSYLARVCEALNVPRPDRGCWQKLAVGKAPAPEPLPEAQPGDQVVWRKDVPLSQPGRRPRMPPRRRQPRANAKVSIPRGQVHHLIRGAKAHFLNTRWIDDGAYLKPFKKLLVHVSFRPVLLIGPLSSPNDLFNALESVGHRVMIPLGDQQWSGTGGDEREDTTRPRHSYYQSSGWSPHRPTVVCIGEVAKRRSGGRLEAHRIRSQG